MNTATEQYGTFDRVVGIILRILLVIVFTLAGAWVVTAISLWGGRAPIGAIIGFLIIVVALLRERPIVDFCKKYKAVLALTGFIFYVIILGLATYSELFDLGWFSWLSC